jgi:predicted membrane protein
MKNKKVSSFTTIYIFLGMFYIIFLIYYIIAEIKRVNNYQELINTKQKELIVLKEKKESLIRVKKTMSTEEYQDRIKKEIKGELNKKEKIYIIPKETLENKVNNLSNIEVPIYWEKSVIDEWRDVFLK